MDRLRAKDLQGFERWEDASRARDSKYHLAEGTRCNPRPYKYDIATATSCCNIEARRLTPAVPKAASKRKGCTRMRLPVAVYLEECTLEWKPATFIGYEREKNDGERRKWQNGAKKRMREANDCVNGWEANIYVYMHEENRDWWFFI